MKTHAQVVLKRLQDGENIFAELDDYSDQSPRSENDEVPLDRKQYFGVDEVTVASTLLLLREDTGTPTSRAEESVEED